MASLLRHKSNNIVMMWSKQAISCKVLILFCVINSDSKYGSDYCDTCFFLMRCAHQEKKCADLKYIVFNNKIQNYIVHLHNTMRNNIALGKMIKFEQAARMATMLWDDELATLALRDLSSCEKGSPCQRSNRFPSGGQNLYRWSGHIDFTVEQLINKAISGWFSEYHHADREAITRYGFRKKFIRHFTLMITDRNTKLGCALVGKYDENDQLLYILRCEYSTNNFLGIQTYQTGPTGSECETGTNIEYLGLCSINETIDPNDI